MDHLKECTLIVGTVSVGGPWCLLSKSCGCMKLADNSILIEWEAIMVGNGVASLRVTEGLPSKAAAATLPGKPDSFGKLVVDVAQVYLERPQPACRAKLGNQAFKGARFYLRLASQTDDLGVREKLSAQGLSLLAARAEQLKS